MVIFGSPMVRHGAAAARSNGEFETAVRAGASKMDAPEGAVT